MKRLYHDFLMDSQNVAIGNRAGRTHPQPLSGQAAFAEKIAFAQYANRRFLAIAGYDGKLDLAFLDVKDCVSCVALRKHSLLFGKMQSLPACTDGGQEGIGIETKQLLRH
jgi:hypothetical protein